MLAGLVVLIAAAARSTGLTSANDLFIDELTYADLSSMLAAGRLPALFGEPFFLHPPGGCSSTPLRFGCSTWVERPWTWCSKSAGCTPGSVLLVLLGYLVVRCATTRVAAVRRASSSPLTRSCCATTPG